MSLGQRRPYGSRATDTVPTGRNALTSFKFLFDIRKRRHGRRRGSKTFFEGGHLTEVTPTFPSVVTRLDFAKQSLLTRRLSGCLAFPYLGHLRTVILCRHFIAFQSSYFGLGCIPHTLSVCIQTSVGDTQG